MKGSDLLVECKQSPSGGKLSLLNMAVLGFCIFLASFWGQIPLYLLPKAKGNACLHFSVDDTIDLFADLTYNRDRYHSLFDQPDLAFFKSLHDQYGIVVTFYCYYSWDTSKEDSFTLADATDAFAQEFSANSDWLRFGFHARDAAAYLDPDIDQEEWYTKTTSELVRITGSADCIDHTLRLDRYLADAETVAMLAREGVTTLLCKDPGSTASTSYDLSEEESENLTITDWYRKGFMTYTPTDLRFESLSSRIAFYKALLRCADQSHLVGFTHAWCLQQASVKEYITLTAAYGKIAGYHFDFVDAAREQ